MPNYMAISKKAAANGLSTPGEGHLTILPHHYASITQGTWPISLSALYLTGGLTQNIPSANGDRINYIIYLAAGVYTLHLLTTTTSISGILDVSIDGFASSKGTIDLFTPSIAYNVIKTITGITISTSGLFTLSLKANGKHPLSGNYRIHLITLALFRTS